MEIKYGGEPIVFWTFFIFVVIGFYLVKNFLGYLKNKHLGIWKELGEPSIIWNNSIRNNVLVYNFVFKRKYAELNDHSLKVRGDLLRYFVIFYIVAFVGVMLFFTFRILGKY